MSIYVYITRRRNPIEDDGPVILEQDWRSAVSRDLSFRDASADEMSGMRPTSFPCSIWLGHPQGLDAWFVWANGQIAVRNPDEPLIAKAKAIASQLDAHVISEMGELFNDDGSHQGFVDGEPW